MDDNAVLICELFERGVSEFLKRPDTSASSSSDLIFLISFLILGMFFFLRRRSKIYEGFERFDNWRQLLFCLHSRIRVSTSQFVVFFPDGSLSEKNTRLNVHAVGATLILRLQSYEGIKAAAVSPGIQRAVLVDNQMTEFVAMPTFAAKPEKSTELHIHTNMVIENVSKIQ